MSDADELVAKVGESFFLGGRLVKLIRARAANVEGTEVDCTFTFGTLPQEVPHPNPRMEDQ